MAGSEIQIENGNFTRIHNAILERLVATDLTLREVKVVLHVMRMTYGFQRRTYIPDTSEISRATNIHPNHVRTTMRRLMDANIILTERGEVGFNKAFEEWVLEQPNQLQKTTKLVAQKTTKSVAETTDSVAQETTKSVVLSNQISCSEQPNQLQKTTKLVADTHLKPSDSAGPGNPKEKRKLKENSKESARVDFSGHKYQPHFELLGSVKGYPLMPKTDADFLAQLEADYPQVDILMSLRGWATRKLDDPLDSKSKPRSQIRTWVGNSAKWGRDLKQTTAALQVAPVRPRQPEPRELSMLRDELAFRWVTEGRFPRRFEARQATEALSPDELKRELAMSELDRLEGLVAPQAIEAEQSVLGAVLISRQALDDVAGILKPEDFYRYQHQVIYQAVVDLAARNEPVDLVLISTLLRDRGEFERAGGYDYLMDLTASIPTAANALHYAEKVKEKAIRRQCVALGRRISEAAMDNEQPDPMGLASSMVLEACAQDERKGVCTLAEAVQQVDQVIDQAIDYYNRFQGQRIPNRVLYGTYDLDRFSLGMGRGDLIILGARPAMGKTALALQIARQVAEGRGDGTPLPVMVFSLEMARERLAHRIICGIADVDSQRVTEGYITDRERESLREATDYLTRLTNFGIVDASNITLAMVRSEARKFKLKHGGLGLIVIDYLQLMEPDRKGKSSDNRVQEISVISRGLKNLARELDVPIIALSQLSRKLEERTNKRPGLSDLRESGSIEQDADDVVFLYRDEYYNPESTAKGTVEVIFAKKREGRVGTVELLFTGSTTKFECRGDVPPITAPKPTKPTTPQPTPAAPPAPADWAGPVLDDLSHLGMDD